MKITKRQLRRIIKEEKRKLLKEQPLIPDGSQGVGIAVETNDESNRPSIGLFPRDKDKE